MAKIYIDPGHGGTDGGAISHGIRESAVVVAISNLLADELKRQGIQCLCSRTNDSTTKTLATRVAEAENFRATAFISLHLDSSSSASPNGTHSYVYQFGGDAEKLANKIQIRLQAENGVSKWERVDDESFYVLRKTTMPAVLVELGFITNDIDRNYLTTATNQKHVAKQICIAICEHFNITYKGETTMANKTKFKDEAKMSKWAINSIKKVSDAGVINGDADGNYRPKDPVTREELAVVIANLLK